MKNALQFLFVAFWLFVSCMPIIFTARYMENEPPRVSWRVFYL